MIWIEIVCYIFLLIIAAVGIFFPEWIYSVRESWKSDTPTEPSKEYLSLVRIGGIILALIVIVLFFDAL